MKLADLRDEIVDRAADLRDRVGDAMRARRSAKVEALPPAVTKAVGNSELAARQAELSKQLAELQFDLGGLVYEMATRDHFRLDVVVAQAAKLQEIDAELGAVERLVRMDDGGAAGRCAACGALHARGAVFCWQCGHDLMQRAAVGGPAAQPAPAPADAATPGGAPQASPPASGGEPPHAHSLGAAPEGTRWPGQA